MPVMDDLSAQGWAPDDLADDFVELVGPLLTRADGDSKQYGFVVQQKHLSRFGRAHGGMLLWLADKAISMKAWEASGRPKAFATLQLDVQFIAQVMKGSFVEAHCQVTQTTGSVVFASGRLMTGDKIVATATGVWKYRHLDKKVSASPDTQT